MALEDNPQYQKAIRRLMNLGPEHQAVLDTVLLDEAFATKEIRAKLSDMSRQARELQQKRTLSLATKRQTSSLALKRKARDIESSDRSITELIAGAGAGLSAYQGYQDRDFARKQAGMIRKQSLLY